MGYSILIPSLGSKKGTAKDYIISLLGSQWPLTARRMWYELKKKYRFSGTYHAVFKAATELTREGVLMKTPDGYRIDIAWVKRLQSFTDILETNYFAKSKLNQLQALGQARSEGNINVLTFTSPFDMEKYLYYLQKDYLLKARDPVIVVEHHQHEWRPLFYLRTEFNFARKLLARKHKRYMLCAGSTSLDKWSAKFYHQAGIAMKTGVECASTCDLVVLGDNIIEIYLPSSLLETLGTLLSKPLEKIRFSSLVSDVFEKECSIQIVINKDRAIAEKIIKQTMKRF